MFDSLLILADIEDVLRAVVPILVVIIWIASQVMNMREKQPAAQPPQRQAPAGAGPQPEGEASIREQVEQFLRQAAEQQSGQRRAKVDEPRTRPAQAALSQATSPGKKKSPPAKRADVPLAEELAAEGLESHHLKTRLRAPFDKRLKPLGGEAGLGDGKLADHLQQTFDHPIGSLESVLQKQQTGQTRQRQESPGAQIAAALRDPQSARQAIILSEILNRPADRW